LIRKGILRLVGPIEVVASPNPDNADLAARVTALEAQLSLSERHHTLSFWTALDKVYDIALQDRVISCIVCGNSSKRADYEILTSNCIFGGGKLERYRCPHCDCVFGAQKFIDQGEDMIGLDYELLYSRYKEGNTSDNEIRTFHSLGPKPNGSYVNWGCGAWNDTIPRLRGDSWNVWGFEPSAVVASEFIVSQKESLPAPLHGLFSNNVIEHFLDPVAQFKEFAALLPSGARMAHSSPCYEYRYEITRFHTIFLLGRSPEVLAERTGFKVVDRIKDGEYINVVFEKL
jgi:hypothetical protein